MVSTVLDPARLATARDLVADVLDPELPHVTIAELGILRDVTVEDGRVVVTITPTYSGCPAMEAIAADVQAALRAAGVDGEVRSVLAPAWTTDWITASGRAKLAEAGIAPPAQVGRPGGPVPLELSIRCPQCGSTATRLVSRFGSTACKSLRVCSDCAEPFDHFKPL